MVLTILKSLPLFHSLSADELSRLATIAILKKFKAGEILFYEGEKARSLCVVCQGNVQVFKTDPKGNKVVIHVFSPVSLVAEVAVLEKIPYPASAEFLSDGQALFIDAQAFENLFLTNSAIAAKMILSLSKKIRNLEGVIARTTTMDATTRVASWILKEGLPSARRQKEVAVDLGLTPETLSRVLTRFRKEGLISEGLWKDIVILDEESLWEYAR